MVKGEVPKLGVVETFSHNVIRVRLQARVTSNDEREEENGCLFLLEVNATKQVIF